MIRGCRGIATIALCLAAIAGREIEYTPYVTSGCDGIFYARGTPTAADGSSGHTEIYRVRADGDQLIDRYAWYAPGRVTLGWSPTAGKIAVLSVMASERGAGWRKQEELRFSLGGAHLASWTNEQLLALGAAEVHSSHGGSHADYRVIGCEQVLGTNEYDFVVEIAGGKRLRFDILTGKLRVPATQPVKP